MAWKDPEIAALRDRLAYLREPGLTLTLEEQRTTYEAMASLYSMQDGWVAEEVQAHGVPAERIAPEGRQLGAAILYLHGGGYVMGSHRTHRHLASQLGHAAQAFALVPHYRLAPEHPYPAAVEDAVASYRWLLDQGAPATGIVLAGDSAGGGLTVATALALRDAGLPQPAGLFCISPWADLTQGGRAYEHKAESDPFCTKAGLDDMARAYLAGADPRTPTASPVHGDLRDLAPLLIHCGAEEVLLSDSTRLAEAAGLAGVEVRLEIWPEMIHVWHWMAGDLAQGRRAIAVAGDWMREKLGG